jgi:hypothetical protein
MLILYIRLISCLLLDDDVFKVFSTLVIGTFRMPEPFFPCCFNGGRLETLLRGKLVATEKSIKRRTPSKILRKSMLL